jgi:hypothetical protein
MFVSLSDYKRLDEQNATIEVTTYHHGLWAGSETLTLQIANGAWVVLARRTNWVS